MMKRASITSKVKGTVKWFLPFYLFTFLPLSMNAQDNAETGEEPEVVIEEAEPLKFGYLSYSAALQQMPQYAIAKRNIEDLRIKYDAETKRSENEFNEKYEAFLEGQHDFAPSILRKRQAELQDMMEKNIAFKEESQRLLAQAEEAAMVPVREELAKLLSTIGKERGYAFILNTDNNALPFINNAMGEDIMPICFPPQQDQ